MSTGSSEDRRRRLADLDDELEEGECASGGYHSSSNTEDYYNRDAALSGESDETISDVDATASSAAANHNSKGNDSAPSASANHNGGARTPSVSAIACSVCGKEFGSKKAVCGHMKIHALEARHGGRKDKGNGKDKKVKKRNVEIAGGCGVTGRRGCSGLGTSMDIVKASPNAEPDHSVMDTVPAEPKLVHQPTPMAFAMPENLSLVSMASTKISLSGESGSKKPIHNGDIDDIAEAGASPNLVPPTETVVHQQPAPPPARKQAPHVHHHNPAAPSPAGRQNPEGYTCAVPECRKWFRTHQALGGHVAAHNNRRPAEAEGMHQDGAVPSRLGSKPEKRYVCKKCPAEFSTGLQLGGHMRKHWNGAPIVPKKKRRLSLIQPLPQPADVATDPEVHRPDDVHLDEPTCSLPIKTEPQSLAPALDVEAAEGTSKPAPGPRVTGRVMLFGIDIGLGVHTPPAAKDSSASTGGLQQ